MSNQKSIFGNESEETKTFYQDLPTDQTVPFDEVADKIVRSRKRPFSSKEQDAISNCIVIFASILSKDKNPDTVKGTVKCEGEFTLSFNISVKKTKK